VSQSGSAPRWVRLFRNNRNQAIRIAVEFELPGNEALIRRDGDRLVIEPVRDTTLLELLGGSEPLTNSIPDVDDALLPLPDVAL
jgi:antitoxin VapB